MFAGKELAKDLIGKIQKTASAIPKDITLMEVCGTHTQTIAKYAIKSILPKNIKLISGPGCPVCVTSQKDIDSVVELALSGVSIATYGDMLKVPGTKMSLEGARQQGSDIKIVYSTTDALKLASNNKNFVFFGIGFETTAPMSAVAIKKGLCVYSAHKTMPNALKTLVSSKNTKIDGFISPGHVSAIIGSDAYKDINAPQVISGFEAVDVLASIQMLLLQIKKREKKVETEYSRVVRSEGNTKAKAIIDEVFEPEDTVWRGLGTVSSSGLKIRDKFSQCDAKEKFKDTLKHVKEPKTNSACRCSDILLGLAEPAECRLFKESCKPDNPIGACMVSAEGACAIAYKTGF